jgi:hypothetical protein
VTETVTGGIAKPPSSLAARDWRLAGQCVECFLSHVHVAFPWYKAEEGRGRIFPSAKSEYYHRNALLEDSRVFQRFVSENRHEMSYVTVPNLIPSA